MSITVNGSTISERDINVESAHHPASDPRVSQRRAAVALVIRELLLQRAAQKELGAEGADEEARIDELLKAELALPTADEDACRRYYASNPEHFRSADLFEVRHILLAAAPEDLPGRDQARAQAEAVVATLAAQPGAFAQLAAAHSACPSKEQGGNLGQISRGQTVSEFESALARLPAGLAPRPIESRFGFHVVDVVQRIDGEQLPFELVRERIADYLEQRAYRRALSQYLQILIGEAEIEGIELNGADSPLLQ
jgi:peptidyl-prolyl cis-trans isomerase C